MEPGDAGKSGLPPKGKYVVPSRGCAGIPSKLEADQGKAASISHVGMKRLRVWRAWDGPGGVPMEALMAKPVSTARQRSVAIVDDDPGALIALKFLLEVEGYRVRSFASGEAFLEVAFTDPPDCLVLDQYMPSMNGLEVVGKMNERCLRLPIVMITASRDLELIRKARAAGVERIVEKPIFDSTLCEAIGTSLKSRRGGKKTGV